MITGVGPLLKLTFVEMESPYVVGCCWMIQLEHLNLNPQLQLERHISDFQLTLEKYLSR